MQKLAFFGPWSCWCFRLFGSEADETLSSHPLQSTRLYTCVYMRFEGASCEKPLSFAMDWGRRHGRQPLINENGFPASKMLCHFMEVYEIWCFTDLHFPEKINVRNDFPYQNTTAVRVVKGQCGFYKLPSNSCLGLGRYYSYDNCVNTTVDGRNLANHLGHIKPWQVMALTAYQLVRVAINAKQVAFTGPPFC